MIVKDNHRSLHRKVERFFASPTLFEPTLHTASTYGKGHGRVEERKIVASGGVPAGYLDWPHVGQVFRLTRTRKRGDKSHHVRDTTFEEDRSRVRCGSIPQVMAAIRNACIGLMRRAGHKNIAAACRFHAARPQAALRLIGLPKTE